MKKIFLSVILFIIIFIASYISVCYLVPGLRIKLAAPPFEYFVESIKHMVVFKTVISAIVAFLFTFIFAMIKNNPIK